MSMNLREVLAIPAGGGKTTLCQDPYYLDVDAMYSLEEAQETYDRINAELQRRANKRPPISSSVIEDHKKRISEYRGPARCLLIHSLEVAHQSGLEVKGVLVPAQPLHEHCINERATSGKWFARESRDNLIKQCRKFGLQPTFYSNWEILQQFVLSVRQDDTDPGTRSTSLGASSSDSESPKSKNEMSSDEENLISILSSAVGCELENNWRE